MPQRFFYDSVQVGTSDSEKNDTIWHQVQSPVMVNQFGDSVTFQDLRGKVLVVDFFFTRCPTICPKLTASMKRLQDSFVKNDSIVQFISISVDPWHDSVSRLRQWDEKFNINGDTWWLLTGERDSIYHFAIQEMRANIADVGVDTAFVHTNKFFLLDRERVVRGFYNGLDSAELKKLLNAVPLLMLEKDRKKTFGEFLDELFGRS
jgi:protein SCO1/2